VNYHFRNHHFQYIYFAFFPSFISHLFEPEKLKSASSVFSFSKMFRFQIITYLFQISSSHPYPHDHLKKCCRSMRNSMLLFLHLQAGCHLGLSIASFLARHLHQLHILHLLHQEYPSSRLHYHRCRPYHLPEWCNPSSQFLNCPRFRSDSGFGGSIIDPFA